MSRVSSLLPASQNQRFTTEPYSVAGVELAPEARMVSIEWPWGRFCWVRPTAVRVRSGQSEQRVRIVDVTRAGQIGLLALSIAFWAIGLIIGRRKEESERERYGG